MVAILRQLQLLRFTEGILPATVTTSQGQIILPETAMTFWLYGVLPTTVTDLWRHDGFPMALAQVSSFNFSQWTMA